MTITTLLCYAQSEEQMARTLKNHLSLLERKGTLTLWDYGSISPGARRVEEVDRYLNEAQIILLLISADFLASNYHYRVTMQRAIARHEREEVRVIPIIMRPVHWQEAPLDKLQALPDDIKPITSWRNRDQGFKNVVDGLMRVVKQWDTSTLVDPIAKRKIFMEKFDQLIAAVKLQLQPPERALHTAGTLQELSIFTPNETTLADLVVGWQVLTHPSQQEEDIATSRRRITCGELANIASQFTTEQGSLAQAVKTWSIWQISFQNSDVPRQVAMTKTFTRELTELQNAI